MTTKEYNTCVNNCADGLYRFMLKGIRDSEKARDLVQDAYEKLWINHNGVESQKAKSYLFTIAYNAMVDLIRKEKRIAVMNEPAIASLHTSQHHHDLNSALHAAIEKLPEDQKSVVLLRDYEGYSYDEIGDITGLNSSQVKVYIYRARLFLREYIGSMEKVI